MRALIISDIHSNLPASEAVLVAAPQHDVVSNLGDIVGYGANPSEVVKLARSLRSIFQCCAADIPTNRAPRSR